MNTLRSLHKYQQVLKALSRSHQFLINQHNTIKRSLQSKEYDIELNTLPVFILSNLASGITSVIPSVNIQKPRSVDAKKIIEQMYKEKVNRVLASPAFFQSLVDYLQYHKLTMHYIDEIYTGGGPVFPNLIQAISICFPNAQIIAVYGSTEAEPIAHINMKKVEKSFFDKMQSGHGLLVGKPINDIKLSIIKDQFSNKIGPFTDKQFATNNLKPMQVGEIVVSGDHVQKEYLNHNTNKNKFNVGSQIWHRTGDAGYLDCNGNLWIVGRCCAKIIKDNTVSYPFCIEAAALSHKEVKKAAVIEKNQEIILIIESHSKDKAKLCKDLLSSINSINTVKIVKTIPTDKRHNSKILYEKLKEIC